MGLMDQDMEQVQAASGYHFSHVKMEKLGSSKYTLATLVWDVSDSVERFKALLEQCMKTVYATCNDPQKCPTRDALMLRIVQFSDDITELMGFKLISQIKPSDFDGILQVGGLTRLFDALDEAITVSSTFGATLIKNDYTDINAVVFVATDGQNNRGTIRDATGIRKSLATARQRENLESINVVLIGVTTNDDDTNLDRYLQDVKDGAGITQYVPIGKATPGKLAKLAEFISQSISSSSMALGTGQPSQPLNPANFKLGGNGQSHSF